MSIGNNLEWGPDSWCLTIKAKATPYELVNDGCHGGGNCAKFLKDAGCVSGKEMQIQMFKFSFLE